MKKLVSVIALTSILTATNAVAATRYQPYMPSNYTIGYNQGYNIGYNKGKNDHADHVAKTVGAVFLIGVSALIIYELAKPSQNNPGQVSLVQF